MLGMVLQSPALTVTINKNEPKDTRKIGVKPNFIIFLLDDVRIVMCKISLWGYSLNMQWAYFRIGVFFFSMPVVRICSSITPCHYYGYSA